MCRNRAPCDHDISIGIGFPGFVSSQLIIIGNPSHQKKEPRRGPDLRKCARGKAAGRPVSSPGSSTCAAAVGVGNERAARPFGPLADPPRAAIPRREQRVAGPRSPAPERVAGVAGPRRRHRPPPQIAPITPTLLTERGQCPGRSLRQERGACRHFRYRTQIGNVSGIGNRSLMYHHPIFRITQHSCRRSCQSVLRGSA